MTDTQQPSRLSRRGVLAGLGGFTAALATPTVGSRGANATAVPTTPTLPSPAPASPTLALGEIQGNVLAGFHKDFQALVFVTLPDVRRGRAWLAAVQPHVASTAEVAAFNAAFKAVVARTAAELTAPRSTWLNLAFTADGLRALGVASTELNAFPEEFRAGMAARAAVVGDVGPNAPGQWPAPYRRRSHAVVLLAADTSADLDAAVGEQQRVAAANGVAVVHVERGMTRADEPGHEHFGFRDGISQPGVRGFTSPTNADNPNQGIPGQDLLWPGEFVLGYPRQAGVGGGDDAGPVATNGPSWSTNGSFMVMRRLTQDVAGFRRFVADSARRQGMSEDLFGAKIVGRYKSGAPLEVTGAQTTDPGAADPTLLGDGRVNDFEFGDDARGTVVPLASHIRKTYPRDTATPDGGEEDTQTHRILRRGIPFGISQPAGATDVPAFPNDRGLLFMCYQTSIARQFEHVQQRWVNDPNFPARDAGHDPVITQVDGARSFTLPGGRPDHVSLMQRFVTTTGGDYFFAPSISALAVLSAATTGTPLPPPPPLSRPPANDRVPAPGRPPTDGRPARADRPEGRGADRPAGRPAGRP